MSRLRRLTTPAGMRAAALLQRQRRGVGQDHRFVVGQLRLVGGQVVLCCVYAGPAYDIPRPPVFTADAARFNRWRTRQAATQFARRWGLDAHVYDLRFADVIGGRVGVEATSLAAPEGTALPGHGVGV